MVSLGELILEFEGGGFLSKEGTRAGLIMLAAMLLSFVFIRVSTRIMRADSVSWWPGSVKSESGLHVHHLVFGIVLMLLTGFVMALQPPTPWFEIMAGGFGIGAGLTLDEFALWLQLEDVYWAEDGRRSVDAVVVAAIVGGLVLLGFLPFSTDDGAPAIVITVLIILVISAVTVFKGKVFMGVAGMLFVPVGIIGAIRLAKPESPWAKRRYEPGSKKLAKSEARYEKHTRRYQRFQDQIAGAPTPGHEADVKPRAGSGT